MIKIPVTKDFLLILISALSPAGDANCSSDTVVHRDGDEDRCADRDTSGPGATDGHGGYSNLAGDRRLHQRALPHQDDHTDCLPTTHNLKQYILFSIKIIIFTVDSLLVITKYIYPSDRYASHFLILRFW